MTAFTGVSAPLAKDTLEKIAASLDADLASVWAVISVETSGAGFLADRRPKILFERHVFSKLTNHAFDAAAPDISNKAPGGYGAPGTWQYDRLQKAIGLNREAALQSASWGLGQVMGYNAKMAGYDNVEKMVADFADSEDAQITAMMRFITSEGIADDLRKGRWAEFAARYNGPDYQKNGYDKSLAYYHARYSVAAMPDLLVRWTQMALTFAGVPAVGKVDGWYGDMTHDAVLRYQRTAGLPETGKPDDATLKSLAQALGWNAPA
jgi:peptidoglycan hydrolase-like protein with peptidoglycan-binding domain